MVSRAFKLLKFPPSFKNASICTLGVAAVEFKKESVRGTWFEMLRVLLGFNHFQR